MVLYRQSVRRSYKFIQKRWTSDLYKQYGKTLELPQTNYSGANPDPSEGEKLIRQSGSELYKWQSKTLPADTEKVFADGPPYANGALHLGHALNKIIKDIINRHNVITGKRVNYIPGWDCHGLPIELEALSQYSKSKGKGAVEKLSVEERRTLSRQTALRMLSKQLEAFRLFGIMADWDGSIYRTLDVDYVMRQLNVFRTMMNKKLITRQHRPVYWSVESQTALAESELEYGEKKSSTAIIKYLLEPSLQLNYIRSLYPSENISQLHAVIWTTTPWTLVANKAIAINEEMEYGIVYSDVHGYCVVAVGRAGEVLNVDGSPARLLNGSFPGSVLLGLKYNCPLRGEAESLPVLAASYVTGTGGTGLVHTAPGHGKEDYLMCKQYGIEPFSPIDDKGRYTKDVHPVFNSLIGLNARKEGQTKVLEMFGNAGAVVSIDINYIHSTPFDWRSKTPVLVRATPQFFANITDIKRNALESLNNVEFHPASGRNRLTTFTQSRTEWCISRQRVWGVPIPALYHKATGELLMTDESVRHIISVIENDKADGLSRWFRFQEDVSEWLPEDLKGRGKEYRKSLETMDVWFDSGTSWTMLNERSGNPLADYYLEGTDQHRGWFQSSLLTKIATSESNNPIAPFKRIITHGFVLDAKGRKMSKSLGNVVTPEEVKLEPKTGKGREKLGIDGLRLWVAQSDYTTDILLSPSTFVQLSSLLKKIRVTFKFLLGNVGNQRVESISYDELLPVDKKALLDLYILNRTAKKGYESFAFNHVVQAVQNHIFTNLSAFYFDIVKDRLYADELDGRSRRSVQYVFEQLLRTYFAILSPITPLLTQEVWKHTPSTITNNLESPFMAGWPELPAEWNNLQIKIDFEIIAKIRQGVLEAMDKGRIEK